ncbi:MAG: hypothetical protein Q8Q04_00625, partial [archaeon]|nr:hypothetical protein [archaeon]
KQEFYIDFFDTEYLKRSSFTDGRPEHFQIGYGDVGGDRNSGGGDPYEDDSYTYQVISSPEDFDELVRDIKKHISKKNEYGNFFKVKYSKEAAKKISSLEKKNLENILKEHNKVYLKIKKGRYNENN